MVAVRTKLSLSHGDPELPEPAAVSNDNLEMPSCSSAVVLDSVSNTIDVV